MAVVRLFVGLRANNEGCRSDKLTFEMLSRSASRIGSVPILANEALGIRVVHGFHKGAFGFWRHGRFTDAQGLVDAAKEPGQMDIADFVGFGAKVGVVHTEEVPGIEMGIGDFPVSQKSLR